jgi:hypothetical protein
MPIRPGFDFVHYAIKRSGKELRLDELSAQEQNELFDLTNACIGLLQKHQCPDHPGATDLLTVYDVDGVRTVSAWACCHLRYLILELMKSQYQVPLQLLGPPGLSTPNLAQLQARLESYFEHL